ncbi:MAG: efflux RND transporter periplasmic adaptor subunit [Nitrospinae bacterium]|nr:efflux RND transporter periplasmic adaptor subunit [Nitrospinota bacterium]
MKRIFYWALGIIILLAVFLAAILGREISLTSFTGSKASEESSTEPDPISITLWSDQAELFLEYPPLVAGHASTFAAHLTDLRTFRPVITGTVEIRMTTTGQPALTFLASAPLRPGIFTPSVTMPEPGTYDMELALMSDSLNETFHIPNVQVLSSKAEVEHQTQQEPLGLQEEVTFLKEQQWKVAFGTKVATNQFLASTITARGEITSKMGQKVVVTAPATGLVVLSPSAQLPIMGQHVEEGEVLVAITPVFSAASRTELESAVSQAALQQEQAQRELHRAQRLYAEKVLAKKQVEQAKTTFLLAKNKHAEAQKRLATLTLAQQVGSADTRDRTQDFLVRAPIQGIIVKAALTLGARVEAGEELFTLINLDHVWLEARVYAQDIPKISQNARASFLPHGMTGLILPDQVNSRLVAIGNVIDPATKTLPVIFEVDNPNHSLKVGMHADVFIETGEKSESVVISPTAVLHESGKKVAFVQTGGETFEKRFITTGITTSLEDEEVVQILEGIKAGERVVTKGAYAIKLAAASGKIPTHAH